MRVIRRALIECIVMLVLVAGFFTAGIVQSSGETVKKSTSVTLKVAFYPLEGFFEYDEDQQECGYGVDYLNELSKYANIKWEYVPVDSWDKIGDLMRDGTVDVRAPVSEPAQPSEIYNYTVEDIIPTYHAIMTRKDRSDLYYKDYDNIARMKLAVTENFLNKTGIMDYLNSIGV